MSAYHTNSSPRIRPAYDTGTQNVAQVTSLRVPVHTCQQSYDVRQSSRWTGETMIWYCIAEFLRRNGSNGSTCTRDFIQMGNMINPYCLSYPGSRVILTCNLKTQKLKNATHKAWLIVCNVSEKRRTAAHNSVLIRGTFAQLLRYFGLWYYRSKFRYSIVPFPKSIKWTIHIVHDDTKSIIYIYGHDTK